LANQSFLTEEACSGIRSLFSSIAAITFLGFMNRYHWFRHMVNIGQTIVWVIVLNAFRIAAVIYVEDQTDLSIASGLPHELFGYLVFFAIFGLVLSTDRLFAAVVLPAVHDSPENVPGMPSYWTESLNWPGGLVDGIAFASAFVLVAFLSIRMMTRVPDYKPMFGESLPIAERDFIPSELSGWRTVDFIHEKRTEHDLQGSESFIWELRKNDKTILLSLDGSFNDFHDLEWCYSALGWGCKSNRLYTSIVDRAQGKTMPEGEFTHIALKKNTGETGHVLFSAVDRNGIIVAPPPGIDQEAWRFISQSLWNAGRYAFGLKGLDDLRASTFEGPVSTVQLVYQPRDPIEEEELDELKKLFLLARESLRKTSRFLPG
jgi:exosortase/archaeosortase family protein